MSAEAKKAPKFLKAGKVVLLLNGRQAGKKAVIVKSFDEGTPDRPYGHALVAGIMKYPLKITKGMSEKKIAKRSRIKPFLKCVNYNHVMPTRYALDVELKSIVTSDVVSGSNPTARQNSRKEVKKILEDKRAQHCAQAALPCGPTMRPRWARQGQDGPATTRLAPPGQRRRTL